MPIYVIIAYGKDGERFGSSTVKLIKDRNKIVEHFMSNSQVSRVTVNGAVVRN